MKSLLFLILLLASAGAAPAWAESKVDKDLHKIETELAAKKAQESALQQKQDKETTSVHSLQQKLVNATKALQDKQAEKEALTDKLALLSSESAQKSAKLKTSRLTMDALTTALIQLSREPPEAFLLHAPMATETIQRGILLRNILPRLKEATTSLTDDLLALEALHKAVAEQQRLVSSAEQNLTNQRVNLDQMIQTRQGLLQKTEEQREALAKQLETLANEAQDLRQLMQKVGQGSSFPKEKETAPPNLKKGLRLPVAGKMIRGYGTRDSYGVLSQGLTLMASAGSPIVAPLAGRVVFAGPFKGYGQIIILAHGRGYHSFLAGFGRIDTETGQDVTAGEPLGSLPERSAAPRSELYFEWRQNGEPVDPASAR